jgi:hypothetical protein
MISDEKEVEFLIGLTIVWLIVIVVIGYFD